MAGILDSKNMTGVRVSYREVSGNNFNASASNITVSTELGKTTASFSSASASYNDGNISVNAEISRASLSSSQTAGILRNANVEATLIEYKDITSSNSVWQVGGRTETSNGYREGSLSAFNTETYTKGSITVSREDGVKAETGVGASASVFNASGAVESGVFKASGEVNVLHAEASANAGVRAGKDGVEAYANVGASVTVLDAKGEASVGDGMLGASVSAEGRVLSAAAEAEAKFGFARNEKTGEYELNAFLSAEANAVLAEGKVGTEVSIAGVDVGAEVGAYIGIGAKVDIGIKNGQFVFDISAALGIGVSLKFTIGFNDSFLKRTRTQSRITGAQYVRSNPQFTVDTVKLRNYAERAKSVNNRLIQLDKDLDKLRRDVNILDKTHVIAADLNIGSDSTLLKIVSYLENAANRFETAERKANEHIGG